MYRAELTETFYAEHSLEVNPKPHSHDWIVKIMLDSETVTPPGFIINYYELKPLLNSILPHHKNLNDTYPFPPTAENLSKHFYVTLKPQLPMLHSVSVGEFESFMCSYFEKF